MGRVRQVYKYEIGFGDRKYTVVTTDIDKAVRAVETAISQDRMKKRRNHANPSAERGG